MKSDKFSCYPYYQLIVFRFFGIVIFLLGIYFSTLSFTHEYIQLPPLVLGIVFIVAGFMCFAESYSTLLIDSKGIKQKNLVKEIYLQKEDVEGFAEIPLRSSDRVSIQLVIFGKDKRKTIKVAKDSHNKDYKYLKQRLSREYHKLGIEYHDLINQRRQKLGKAIGQGFGLLLFLVGCYQLLLVNVITTENLYELKGELYEIPTLVEEQKGRIPSLSFTLTTHNEFSFRATGNSYRILHPNSFRLKKNDKVTLLILKSDYLQKVKKSETPETINKYVNWDIVELYGLVANNQTLLDLREINKSRGNKISKVLFMLMGLGIFLYYRYK